MLEQSLYRPTLKKAWQITKKFKSLWILGFFATLLSSGGEYEIITRFFYSSNNKGYIAGIIESFNTGLQSGLSNGANLWQSIWATLTTSPITTLIGVLIIILGILVTVFVIWLGITSQIALIKNISTINKNKRPTLNEGIGFGVKTFWPVFFSNVVLKIALFILFLIFGALASFFTSGVWQTIAYFVVFVVFIILAMFVAMIPKFQTLFIILNRQTFWQSLKSAWILFSKNWLICLEMALMLLAVYIIGSFISAFASILLVTGPLYIIPVYFSTIAPIAAYIILGVCFILMIAIIILVAAFVTTYQWAAWTLLFNRISGGEEESKIMRTIGQIQSLPVFPANK